MALPIRVLLVDDHALFRQGLASLLSSQPDIEVVGEAVDGIEAQVKAQELRPDLILMDLTMPGCDGLEATQRIKQALPDVRIVMLTVHDEDDRLFEAIKSGAVGYLLKSTAAETLIPMLRGVMRGEAAISGAMAARMLEAFGRLARQTPFRPQQEEDVPVLTARQREVLRLVAAGAMDKEIAAELSISLSTVKTHLRNILAKLQATSRHQAAAYAVQERLILPPEQGGVLGEK
jgi:DNA-binding NarL/FixJ family response regulator